ncbi:MAG: biotin/lipoyl-binding protein [Bacteroidales bacterium]|nr:biotin/lipoyl-binding protein [Bacteroidales bacterium]MDT8372650.1 biotin/lipoyl-containing protein [Bacteroidales bacterium]
MKNYKFKINGNQYEVEVLDIDDNVARIEVNGTLYEVEMQREIPKVKIAAPPPQSRVLKEVKPLEDKSAGKALEVRSPLPGVIMQVLVRTGDEVKAGQSVCTLETMKMENAIKAENGGKVTAVNISPGQSVLQDEVLIVINQ